MKNNHGMSPPAKVKHSGRCLDRYHNNDIFPWFCNLLRLTGVLLSATFFVGCSSDKANPSYGKVEKVAAEGPIAEKSWLEQNWDAETRFNFWYTSQGTHMVPYAWFTWLEQKDRSTLFRHSNYMQSLGYIPDVSSDKNPAGLPIGFALDIDKRTGDAWMGFTCAACHTGQVNIGDRQVLVEGGVGLGDFNGFMRNLYLALVATRERSDKFERFAERILGEGYSPSQSKHLESSMDEVITMLNKQLQVNRLPKEYGEDFAGHGRIDAFGIIQNAASAIALDDLANNNTPSAPVSYPFLWGAHQSDVVQWNGMLPNTGLLGPLARNVGEVVGSMGGLKIRKAPWWRRTFLRQQTEYTATVDITNAGQLEAWLRDLRSPQWPVAYLPKIDDAKQQRGEKIYDELCAGCHQRVARENEHELYDAKLIPVSVVGTDEVMANNAINHRAKTLILEGVKKAIYAGEAFGPDAPAIEFAINGTFGLMLNEPVVTLRAARNSRRLDHAKKGVSSIADQTLSLEQGVGEYIQAYEAADNAKASDDGLVYKARPLTGIWSTAPFLHNGSVPTLWDLLTPPEQRPNSFWVGNREFDSLHVGYKHSEGLFEFKVMKVDGITIQPGNSNRGHPFGTHLNDDDRSALLEFLKSL